MRCCEEFKKAVDKGVIKTGASFPYYLEEQDWVDDGDDRMDNMGDWLEIRYCPFCGKSLVDDEPYWCPSCHSHNIRQLGERGRPWHCNGCGREFPDTPKKGGTNEQTIQI